VPAVEAVNALGKQVWVATWSAEELSSDLRVRCFGHISLSEGIAAFRVDRPRDRERSHALPRWDARGPARMAPRSRPLVSQAFTVERALEELRRAEARLPHVSRGYFVMRWKSHQLPPAGHEREALVQQMIDVGMAEEFEVTDAEGRSIIALRARDRDGNVALPE
jgi:hypothetical protein